MITNIEIAIMNRLNDLGRRFGLEPWQFVAVYRSEDGSVTFDGGRPSDPDINDKFQRMLKALGCGPDKKIPGDDEEDVFAAIEAVMSASPKVWSR